MRAKIPVQSCPCCSGKVNTAKAITDGTNNTPLDGDLCVCLHCGEVLAFNADTSLRKPKDSDYNRFELIDLMRLSLHSLDVKAKLKQARDASRLQ